MSATADNPPLKRPVGRPPTYIMPEKIDADVEEVARSFLKQPPKEWEYVKHYKEPTR